MSDTAENAAVAIAQVRATIDHQVKAASDLDTKLSALITGLGTASGLVATRLTLDEPLRVMAFLLSASLVAATLGLAFNALRPRAASFGVDPGALTAVVDGSKEDFNQEVLNGLALAWQANNPELVSKATDYQRSLFAFFLTLLSLGPLIATRAVQ